MKKSKSSSRLRDFIVIHSFQNERPVTSEHKGTSKQEIEALLNLQKVVFYEVCEVIETGNTK